jgi:hypothetical protein
MAVTKALWEFQFLCVRFSFSLFLFFFLSASSQLLTFHVYRPPDEP